MKVNHNFALFLSLGQVNDCGRDFQGFAGAAKSFLISLSVQRSDH
jgi:hypothetical protein